MCVCAQLWLAAHTHTHTQADFHRMSTLGKDLATLLGNPVESPRISSHRTRTRISHSPFAKMFLLEFYFISLDFDGFIVYPAPVMESLSPPAWLPPPPHISTPASLHPLSNDASKMRMQILCVLLNGFWQCSRGMWWVEEEGEEGTCRFCLLLQTHNTRLSLRVRHLPHLQRRVEPSTFTANEVN